MGGLHDGRTLRGAERNHGSVHVRSVQRVERPPSCLWRGDDDRFDFSERQFGKRARMVRREDDDARLAARRLQLHQAPAGSAVAPVPRTLHQITNELSTFSVDLVGFQTLAAIAILTQLLTRDFFGFGLTYTAAVAALVVLIQAQVLNLFMQLRTELQLTYLFISHDLGVVRHLSDRVAIMGHGEIAQIGAPKDIYRTPRNRFVAEFVGRNNILSGTVAAIDAGRAAVETPIGRFAVPVARDSTFGNGAPLSFVVAADVVKVSNERPAEGNFVACRLISEEFVGAMVTLFFEADGGAELKAQVQQRELDLVDTRSGASLYLSWQPERAHVLSK